MYVTFGGLLKLLPVTSDGLISFTDIPSLPPLGGRDVIIGKTYKELSASVSVELHGWVQLCSVVCLHSVICLIAWVFQSFFCQARCQTALQDATRHLWKVTCSPVHGLSYRHLSDFRYTDMYSAIHSEDRIWNKRIKDDGVVENVVDYYRWAIPMQDCSMYMCFCVQCWNRCYMCLELAWRPGQGDLHWIALFYIGYTRCVAWPVRLNGRAFTRDFKGRGFESPPVRFEVTALGKLLTFMCLYHQAV